MIPSMVRNSLALFVLTLGGELSVVIVAGGDAWAPRIFLSASLFALAISLLWHFMVSRPLRVGVQSLTHRIQSLSTVGDKVEVMPSAGLASAIRNLDHLLEQRQLEIAADTRRMNGEIDRLKAIYQHSHDAVMLFEPNEGLLVDCNPRAEQLLGQTLDALKGKRLVDVHDDDAAILRSLIDDVMDRSQGRSARLSYRAADGRIVPADVSLSRILLNGDRLLLCSARDASEREDAAQKIEHLAYHDTLTNLPNRTLLTERINRALVRARRTGQQGALLFLDLDKFKRINDSLGHSVGDELLKELAERLRNALREEDTVARLGGDEFVVLLEGLGHRQEHAVEDAREITEKVRDCFHQAFQLNGHELFVTASIGIVTFPDDGGTVDTLLRHADTAMYHAKGSGRDGARVFEQQMDEAAMSRLQFENQLRNGLKHEEFELYFQPVLNIRDGSVLGAEALLRWQHPESGLISPSDFLPYIENCALMLQLDDWVLNHACQLLGRIKRDDALHLPDCLSLNISQQQFHQPDFVQRLQQVIADSGADATRLQLEITETMLLKDNRDSVERMNALKQIGIRFAIDDFGTGYSSLADLRQLPIDTLKIDRSLIRDIATDPNDAAIVRAILSMIGHIGLNGIAEGVESREQLRFLREAGCTHYQGYLGRPPLTESMFLEDLSTDSEVSVLMPPPRRGTRTTRVSQPEKPTAEN